MGTGGQADTFAGATLGLVFPTEEWDWRTGSSVSESGGFVGVSAGREEEVVFVWVEMWAWVWRLMVWAAWVVVPPPKGLDGNGRREFGLPAGRTGGESVAPAHRIPASVWQSCVVVVAFIRADKSDCATCFPTGSIPCFLQVVYLW